MPVTQSAASDKRGSGLHFPVGLGPLPTPRGADERARREWAVRSYVGIGVKAAADTGIGNEGLTGLLASVSFTADTGTGSEPGATVGVTGSDVGVGAEGTSTRTISASVADTGSGVDLATAVATFTAASTGAGVETADLVVDRVSAGDSGAGADSTTSLQRPVSDVAAGVETTPVVAIVAIADAGQGVEPQSIIGRTAAPDTGNGADSTSTLAVVLASSGDSGGEADTAQLVVSWSRFDTGAGAEGGSGIAQTSSGDAALGADATSRFERPVSDTGSGADTYVSKNILQIDGATGADTAALSVVHNIIDSTGVGTDTAQVPTKSSVGDSAAGVENVSAIGLPTRTESAACADSSALVVVHSRTDVGAGTEGATSTARSLDDAATGVDATPERAFTIGDTGAGNDVVTLIVFHDLLDTLHVNDRMTALDYGSFNPTIAADVIVPEEGSQLVVTMTSDEFAVFEEQSSRFKVVHMVKMKRAPDPHKVVHRGARNDWTP